VTIGDVGLTASPRVNRHVVWTTTSIAGADVRCCAMRAVTLRAPVAPSIRSHPLACSRMRPAVRISTLALPSLEQRGRIHGLGAVRRRFSDHPDKDWISERLQSPPQKRSGQSQVCWDWPRIVREIRSLLQCSNPLRVENALGSHVKSDPVHLQSGSMKPLSVAGTNGLTNC
jgi:hypothetical protein